MGRWILIRLPTFYWSSKHRRIFKIFDAVADAFGRALSTLDFHLSPVKEIVILGGQGSEFEKEVWREYLPNKIAVPVKGSENSDLIPLPHKRKLIDEKPTAYIRENFVYQKPTTSIEDFKKQMSG